MKQTAVELLFQQLDEQVYRIDRLENRINISISFEDMETIKSNSKQMEKEQMRECYDNVFFNDSGNELNFEQYYNETYVENEKADGSRMDS
jgi:hypothetical protein